MADSSPPKSIPVNSGGNQIKYFIDRMQQDPQFLGVMIAFIIGVFTLLFVFVWTRRKNLRRSILLTGTCDAGKTAIFSLLTKEKPVESYTSMKENVDLLNLPGKSPVELVDLPGHERLRSANLDRFGSFARAVVYVIDAATIQKQMRDVAEYLFKILSDPVVNANRPPVLIVCNKQDLTMAKGCNVIQRELEKELQLLRETHSRSLQGTDNSEANRVYLGKTGQDFAFHDLNCKVSFCEASSADAEGLVRVKEWITSVA